MKNITDYFEKIYCINLNEDVEKLKYFDNELKKTKIITSYEKFSAISGYIINLSEISDDIITNHARKQISSRKQQTFGISLTYGSLGCALSHKKIFEECQYANKPYLIFEDDIIVEPNFHSIFPLILEQNINYDIIYLGYNEIPGLRKQKIEQNDVISNVSGLITGLYGYILSPIGAQKLLSTIFPINKQIDSSISDNSNKLNLFCSTKRILGVTHKFGSKTQREKSCKNINNSLSTDDWNKLFLKGV